MNTNVSLFDAAIPGTLPVRIFYFHIDTFLVSFMLCLQEQLYNQLFQLYSELLLKNLLKHFFLKITYILNLSTHVFPKTHFRISNLQHNTFHIQGLKQIFYYLRHLVSYSINLYLSFGCYTLCSV